MNKVKYLANKRVGHIDKFRITGNLNYRPDNITTSQKLLKQGYRILFRNGKKFAIKGLEEIECQ